MYFLLAVLAVWRVSALVAGERGLFKIGIMVRALCGVLHTPQGEIMRVNGAMARRHSTNPLLNYYFTEMANGVTCIWCNSLWFSPMAVYALQETIAPLPGVSVWVTYILFWLAISAAVITLERVTRAISDLPDALRRVPTTKPMPVLDGTPKVDRTSEIRAAIDEAMRH